MYSNAYVVFENVKGHWWCRFLSPINHCFLMLVDNGRYIIMNKTTTGLEVYTLNDVSGILKDKYVIKAQENKTGGLIPMLNTCVGITKRYLGINKPFILTPRQLYKYLEVQNNGKLT